MDWPKIALDAGSVWPAVLLLGFYAGVSALPKGQQPASVADSDSCGSKLCQAPGLQTAGQAQGRELQQVASNVTAAGAWALCAGAY